MGFCRVSSFLALFTTIDKQFRVLLDLKRSQSFSTVLNMPKWPPMVDEWIEFRTWGTNDRDMSYWKYDGRHLRTNSLHRTSLMTFRLRSSSTSCHVGRGSPCDSWLVGGVPLVTNWNRFFNAGLALCADAREVIVSESLGVSVATALSKESTESLLATGGSFESFRNTINSMLVGRKISWINVWTFLQSSLSRPKPLWGTLIRRTWLFSAWLLFAPRDSHSAFQVGLWKKRAFVIKWQIKHCDWGIHWGQMTSPATISFPRYFTENCRLRLWAVPAPSFKSVEIEWAMEPVDCSILPWICEYWKCLRSGGLSFVRLGHS